MQDIKKQYNFCTNLKMLFRDIIGQNEIKHRLIHNYKSGKIAHAQLFTGKQGVGSFQLALAFAQYICCENPSDEDACGTCKSCKQFAQLVYPDLYFIFPVIKTTEGETSDVFVKDFRELILEKPYFTIDDWHEKLGSEGKQSLIYEKESASIIEKVSMKPFYDKFKIFIIWLPERMNTTCANKILKVLEEPYPQTLFLLVSEEPELLLSTILSRVQQIPVPLIAENDIAAALLKQDEEISEQTANDIAHIACGSYSKALQALQTNSNTQVYFESFKALMRNAWLVAEKQDYDALVTLRKWSLEIADSKVGRERQCAFLQYCQNSIRENYIFNYQQSELNYQMQDEREFSTRFARFITEKNVEKMMDLFSRSEEQIRQNGNAKIVFFYLCLEIIVLIKQK